MSYGGGAIEVRYFSDTEEIERLTAMLEEIVGEALEVAEP